MRRRHSFSILLLALAAACNDRGPTVLEPVPEVHALTRVAGDSLTGMVAKPLTRLRVRAEDADGNPLRNVQVRFFVPLGSSGSIDASVVLTNAEGIAESGMWVLGTRSGEQLVRVHAQDVATVFTAVATPDAPVGLVNYAGDRQVTLANTPVRVPPAVRVVDRFGNGVPGVPVHFNTQASSVASGDVQSDSAGIAEALSWTPIGSADMALVATSPALAVGQATFTARVVDELFGIEFRALGAIPPRLAQALERAAARWMSVVAAHIGTSQVTLGAGSCGPTSPSVSESIRDVVVFVRVTPIDGQGEILASALPCAVHEESGLPVIARITFDSSDVAQYVANDWVDLIATHELGHALGFGTVWEQRGLVLGSGTTNPRFSGASAAREYAFAFGGSNANVVPVENTGGAGTANRHWRASVFPVETMNGFIDSPTAPLSRITIGAMEDIGYRVNYDAADAYPPIAAFLPTMLRLELRHEVIDRMAKPRVMPRVRHIESAR
jgi:hypothetical protein